MKFIFVSLFVLLSTNIHALSVGDDCENLKECTEAVSKLTGVKYFYSGDLKGKLTATSNMVLTKENADEYFSHFLYLNNYTRLPSKEENTYNIISTRDIRYSATKQINTDSKNPPNIPNTYDFYMMTYQLKHVSASAITRSFRPFMSRYGRLLDIRGNNRIIIQDTAINIKRLYNIIQQIDKPASKAALLKLKLKDQQDYEIKRLRAKNCTEKKPIEPTKAPAKKKKSKS